MLINDVIPLLSDPKQFKVGRFQVEELSKDGKILKYIPSLGHSKDPSHHQWDLIRGELEKTPNVDIVLTEIKNELEEHIDNGNDAINSALEGGFIQFLGRERDKEIEWKAIDLTSEQRFKYFHGSGFSVEDIIVFDVARKIASHMKVDKITPSARLINEILNDHINKVGRALDIQIVLKLEQLIGKYPQFIDGKDIENSWLSPIELQTGPALLTLLSKMSNQLTQIRDTHMAIQIAEHFNQGKNVVALSADYHVYRQWPAIKKLVRN